MTKHSRLNVDTALEQWETSLLNGLLMGWSLGAARVKHVRYEDLVMAPEKQLQALCQFLNVQYAEEMLAYVPPFTLSAEEFHEVLSEEEIATIGRKTYGPLRLLGYIGHSEYEQLSCKELNKVNERRSRTFAPAAEKTQRAASVHPQVDEEDCSEVPPLFIIAHGRSGTTLLRMMLSAHPRIFISSEGAYVCPLRCNFSKWGDLSDIHNLEKLRGDLLPWLEAVSYLNPPDVDALAAWVKRFGGDEHSLIRFYGTWEARVIGKKHLLYWGDNEPSHVFNIPYFKELFPKSKFILMIRDPRDVYASYKSAWPGYYNAYGIALCWRKALLDGRLAASVLGDATVKQVRYEDLVMDPKGQLEEICEFLQVEYSDAMLNFFDTHPVKQLSKVSHHRNLAKPVFTTSIGKFRQLLTEEEIAMIERHLHSSMRCLGYMSAEPSCTTR